MPLLTACGEDRPQVGIPPAEWTAPVAWPVVPEGEAVCWDEESGAPEPCLSDLQSAKVMGDLGDALDDANGRLLRLRDWFAEMARATD